MLRDNLPDDIQMTDANQNSHSSQTHDQDNDKGKEKFYSMLTSHDDGYQELILSSDNLDESMLDDEEEWKEEENGDEEANDSDKDANDIDEEEMVIECPFEEPRAALLDFSNEDTLLESPHANLEPVSLDNILPAGSRRTRPSKFD